MDNETIKTSSSKRVVVTAPSNKAVTVIASKFLEAISNLHDFPLNLILIGVEDKLMDEEPTIFTAAADSLKCDEVIPSSSTLRNIFIYSWVEAFVIAYRTMMNELCSLRNIESILGQSKQYYSRILRGIPLNAQLVGYTEHAAAFHSALEGLVSASPNIVTPTSLEESLGYIQRIVLALESLNEYEASVKHELLSTANIIFCTLSTAGNAAMVNTRKIHGR